MFYYIILLYFII